MVEHGNIDPAISLRLPYRWQLQYATCAKLFNHPDAPAPAGWQLVPEVAGADQVGEHRQARDATAQAGCHVTGARPHAHQQLAVRNGDRRRDSLATPRRPRRAGAGRQSA